MLCVAPCKPQPQCLGVLPEAFTGFLQLEHEMQEHWTVNVILSIIPSREDRMSLREILRESEWKTFECHDLSGTQPLLASANVVLCDEELPQGGWKDVLRQTQELDIPPMLVVTSCRADDCLWAEVLNCGGYDLVSKPFRIEEVLNTVRAALSVPRPRRQSSLRASNGGSVAHSNPERCLN
jgi:DNA-binding response OmpR family regulator